MPQLHGGPLDGLTVETPGSFLSAVVAYQDPATGQVLAAVVENTCSCHQSTVQDLALLASAARAHIRDKHATDPDDAIARVEQDATMERVDDLSGGGRR